MTDHPRPHARERLLAYRAGHGGGASGGRTPTTAHRVVEPCVFARALRFMAGAFVCGERAARAAVHQRHPRRGDEDTRLRGTAVGADGGLVATLSRRGPVKPGPNNSVMK